jgi:hypothetical protein
VTALDARHPVLRVVLVVALLDWAVALAMTVSGTNRQVAVPVLVTAACVALGLQLPWLRPLVHAVRSAPGRGVSRWAAAEAGLAQRWSPTVARLVLREPRLVWSVVLLLRGRRDGDQEATFSGHRDALPMWVVLGVLAALEVGVTPLLPLPDVLGAVLLVVGIWTIALVLGVTAALVVHPHVVEPDRIRARFGFWDEVAVPRDAVHAVRAAGETGGPRGLTVADGTARLSATGVTNVEVVFSRPLLVRGNAAYRLLLWADDPRAFASACRP